MWHGIGDIRLDDVPDPQIEAPTDAIVRLTTSAICGTDLHFVRGTVGPMKPGTVLGHEGVGIVEQVGKDVRNLKPGDRVVIPSTIACGYCSYCRAGYFAMCNNANPHGPQAGSAFYGGPAASGPFNGLQAERARIPFANIGAVKLPDEVTDEQAILLSDIFPTGYFAADLAQVETGDVVAVFGCGPVGQFAIASAKLMDAGRIIAVDTIPTRLDMARDQGAEVINYNEEDPVEAIRRLTGGTGADRVIDAVGVDANHPSSGPAAAKAQQQEQQFAQERQRIDPNPQPSDGNWHPGDAPSQVWDWAVKAADKAGTIAIIGVYPQTAKSFPMGEAFQRNLTINTGNCNHRKYLPMLIDLVRSGAVDPTKVLTQIAPFSNSIEAFEQFDERQSGWVKVELVPGL